MFSIDKTIQLCHMWYKGKLFYFHRPICFRRTNEKHHEVIKWKHFPRYWPFVRGIHPSLVNSPHKGQWRGALMLSLTCTWIHSWVNNCEAVDLRRHHARFDVIVMEHEKNKMTLDNDAVMLSFDLSLLSDWTCCETNSHLRMIWDAATLIWRPSN